jgi:hypothetical protein
LDHIDNDPLNNAWDNLRQASRSQNQANRRSYKGAASQYLGVSKHRGKWAAGITSNYKFKRLGVYENEVDAALAYDRAASEMHGSFANLNFPSNLTREWQPVGAAASAIVDAVRKQREAAING